MAFYTRIPRLRSKLKDNGRKSVTMHSEVNVKFESKGKTS